MTVPFGACSACGAGSGGKKGPPVPLIASPLDHFANLVEAMVCPGCWLRFRPDVCMEPGCDRPAPYASGCDLLHGVPGFWSCRDHRRPTMAVAPIAPTLDAGGQQRLDLARRSSAEPIADKVAHVQAAGQDRDHVCHWPGCRVQVPPAVWGCRPHWYKLPKRLRDRIWNAYRPGQETTMTPSADYVAVAREVQDWIAANAEPIRQGELLL